ncbi:dodecin [Ferrimonas sp.]|uniref:dodecin n=1 Tax=Ferrimonas sp. TaxID=2080861 RepID=UPI003A952B3F
MGNHTYKKLELVGSSRTSMEDAINSAIDRAHQTVANLRWFEVVETRGQIENGKVAYWQVTLKVGFTLEE